MTVLYAFVNKTYMGVFVVKVYSLINTGCSNGEYHKPVHVKGQ